MMTEKRVPFHITGIDRDQKLSPGFEGWPANATVSVGAEDYLLRNACGRTLFRREGSNCDEWTWFAYDAMPNSRGEIKAWLQNVLALELYGRLVVWISNCKHDSTPASCALLLYHDGSGVTYTEGEAIEFSWRHDDNAEDVRLMDYATLLNLAGPIIQNVINPQLEDPFIVSNELAYQPIEFICGSKETLAELTRWICWSEPELFASQASILVGYNSSTTAIDEDGVKDESGVDFVYDYHYEDINVPDRMIALLNLAFDYNNFTGASWEYHDYSAGRLSGYDRTPEGISVEVLAPSAHERAEALLRLSEWLDRKVPKAEKVVLLGLAEGTE